jgi:hydrogenase expression/formation protein HypE
MSSEIIFSACPAPILDHKAIVLGHGSGGRLTHQLLEKVILPVFRNPTLKNSTMGQPFR